MAQTLVIFESKYGLTEAIAKDIGRILGPARVCRARDLAAAAQSSTASPGDVPARAIAASDDAGVRSVGSAAVTDAGAEEDVGADVAGAPEDLGVAVEAAPAAAGSAASGCSAAFAGAELIVIVTPVYRHAPDEHIVEFVRANRDSLCSRHVAVVCVGLATSPGAVRSYLRPLLELLGDSVSWTGGLGGRIALDWLDASDRADVEQAEDLRAHRGLSRMDAYSAEAVAEAALAIKDVRDSYAKAAPAELVRRHIDEFLAAHNTCTLCTGAGQHVRATPVEYAYRDGDLYLLSEGGEKFAHLMVNPHVSVAVYEPYQGMEKLAGLQLLGRVELVDEASDEYLSVLDWRGLEPPAVAALPFTLSLLRVHLERAEFLWSGFKDLGYDPHQIHDFAPLPPGEPRA